MIERTGSVRREPRYPYPRKAGVHAPGGSFAGQVRDVSATGIAVNLSTDTPALIENGQFVDMHVEGMGQVRGQVARTYDGGFAARIDAGEEDRRRIAAAVRHYNQLA